MTNATEIAITREDKEPCRASRSATQRDQALCKAIQSDEKAAAAVLATLRLEQDKVASLTQQCKELLDREDGWMDAILELQEYCCKLERGEVMDRRPALPRVLVDA